MLSKWQIVNNRQVKVSLKGSKQNPDSNVSFFRQLNFKKGDNERSKF